MPSKPFLVRGAYYYCKEDDAIYVPHYTGEYCIVDADRFFNLKDLKDRYDAKYIKENKDNYVTYEGKKYYYAEFSPIDTDGLDLLSDLYELEHIEESYDFD